MTIQGARYSRTVRQQIMRPKTVTGRIIPGLLCVPQFCGEFGLVIDGHDFCVRSWESESRPNLDAVLAG